jgi:hypothetical protein
MAHISGRGRRAPGLGALRDDHVRVRGPLGLAVAQAAQQNLPARRVKRHRQGTAAEFRRPGRLVDVAHAQVPDLVAGSTVEQREDAQQRLVRVGVTARRPAAEQFALLVQDKGLAGEPGSRLRR